MSMENEPAGPASPQPSAEAGQTPPENRGRKHNKNKKPRRYELPSMPPGLIWRRPKTVDRGQENDELSHAQPAKAAAETKREEPAAHAAESVRETLPILATEQAPVLAEPLNKLPPAHEAERQPHAVQSEKPPVAPNGWVEDFARMPGTDEQLQELPKTPAGFAPQPRFWEQQEVKQPGARERGTLPTPVVPGAPKLAAADQSEKYAPEKVEEQITAPEQAAQPEQALNPVHAEAAKQPAETAPKLTTTPERDKTEFAQLAAAERAIAGARQIKAYLLHERGQLAEQLTPEAVDYVEWLGGSIVTAEQRAGEQAGTSPETPKVPETRETPSQTNMDRAELLAVAEAIRIDGVSVKEMFSANRIDEQGLRSIVIEFLRGRDVRRIVTQEVIREQLKFERDPQLRHIRRLGRGAGAVKAVGSVAKHAKHRAKQVADPQRAKHHAVRLGTNLLDGFDEAKEVIDAHPQIIKVGGGIAAVLIYSTILILLITH